MSFPKRPKSRERSAEMERRAAQRKKRSERGYAIAGMVLTLAFAALMMVAHHWHYFR